jgi:hypothetical protein
MPLKEGSLYRCPTSGMIVMVVKAGEGATTMSSEHGAMELHTPGLSDLALAGAASGSRVKPGTIVRQEIRVAHELADGTFPVTGVSARLEWEKGEEKPNDKTPTKKK